VSGAPGRLVAGVRRGGVWLVNLDPVVGHEQGGRRPALIVSSDHLHAIPSRLVIVVPITTRSRGMRAHVPIQPPEGGLAHPSYAVTEQSRAISIQRLDRRLGDVGPATLAEVAGRLRWFMDL
jgi:mRNA interferase MazF